jgi:hypothetical protein
MEFNRNPFRYGADFGPEDIVGRKDEIARAGYAVRDGQRLFLVGPRGFGKTSILRAAWARNNTHNISDLRPLLPVLLNRLIIVQYGLQIGARTFLIRKHSQVIVIVALEIVDLPDAPLLWNTVLLRSGTRRIPCVGWKSCRISKRADRISRGSEINQS